MIQTLKVRHNAEVAHRLSQTPGKCQQIHGHSLWIVAEFYGTVNDHGLLLGMDFGDVKKAFRNHIDTYYDHHLLLNKVDPLGGYPTGGLELPGAVFLDGDPTTENIARWIGEWCVLQFGTEGLYRARCEVWETQTNSATWEERNGEGPTTY